VAIFGTKGTGQSEGTFLSGTFPTKRDYFNFPFKGEGIVLSGAFPLRDYKGLIGDWKGTKMEPHV